MTDIKKVKITIDGKQIEVPSTFTIMQAAESIGIKIPRLCYHPKLSVAGSCRVCIVKVEGSNFYFPSCSTKVVDNMAIEANSPEIRQARRDIVELILDNHPKECQTCERDGNCELQNLAYRLGVRERLFEGKRKRHPIEDSSKSVIRDPEKCILCGRCIRVCKEVQGVYNLSQQNRGFSTVVTPAYEAHMDDSVCIQCGQCVERCPADAIFLTTESELEKKDKDGSMRAFYDKHKDEIYDKEESL